MTCRHCQSVGQFVSHGFIYRNRNNDRRYSTGKRLICSNRRGFTGCGKTMKLMMKATVPKIHYTALKLMVFIKALLIDLPISQAYAMATKTESPRNAYRWIHKMAMKLGDFKSFLFYTCYLRPAPKTTCQKTQKKREGKRLTIQSPLKDIFKYFQYESNPCSAYQHDHQLPFL